MAEYRPIKTKIWQDSWFLSLTPEEKAVWLFLLTNQNVHISGIYELPLSLISPLVGTSKTEEIIKKFEENGKIEYKSGWIYIKNYLKNQTKQINKKDNIIKSIIAYLSENSHLVELFNLSNEAPYKPLITPLPKVIKRKEESNKDFFLIKRLKNWNDTQSNPIRDFKPENIVNKHGAEKVEKLLKQYGDVDNGMSKFLTALKV